MTMASDEELARRDRELARREAELIEPRRLLDGTRRAQQER
jgi:hypothetical protein